MLKVECESCKAPYQIDERRVPASGLKMRCPKCGHSFVVKSPGAAEAAPAASPAGPTTQGPAAAQRAQARPAPPPAPPMQRPPVPKPPPSAPSAAPPAAKPSLPAALAPSDLDLPAVPADLPAAAPARPQGPPIVKRATVAGPGGAPPPRVVKVGPGTSKAPPAPPPGAAKPDFGLDLPAFAGPGAPAGGHDDLPAIAADLPAARSPLASPGAGAGLPAVKPGLGPTARHPNARGTLAFGGGAPEPIDIGLPALAEDNLPARMEVDLPARMDIGLPSPASVGLPSPANVGLPSPQNSFPSAKAFSGGGGGGGFGEIDLPVPQQDLPSIANALPAVAHSLPSVAGSLPSVAGSLPSVANSLPSRITDDRHLPVTSTQAFGAGSLPPAFGADDFGELELPRPPGQSQVGPPPQNDFNDPPQGHRQNQTLMGGVSGGFGGGAGGAGAEGLFDDNPFTSSPPAAGGGEGGFGELELPVPPNEHGRMPGDFSPAPHGDTRGGMTFGELDLGGGGSEAGPDNRGSVADNPFGEASLGSVIQPPPTPGMGEVSRMSALGGIQPPDGYGAAGAEATLDPRTSAPRTRERPDEGPRKPSALPKIFAVLLTLVVVVGISLMAVPWIGLFGSNFISDTVHAPEYLKLANDALAALHAGLKSDVFIDARNMSDALAQQHAAKPRARTLTAVAAIAELETELRFGKDPEHANRVKVWITHEIPEGRGTVPYVDVAQAAMVALDHENDKARPMFEAAAKKYASDPILQDVLFMRGELEGRAHDGAAMAAAYTKALAAAPGARAHFGLARAAFMVSDYKTAKKELDLTLADSPSHGDALLLRAALSWAQGHDDTSAEGALKDIKALVEGPAKAKISDSNAADAFSLRGVIQFARGRSAEARDAFDAALKKDARNLTALSGQAEIYYEEGRYTEALTRFDTVLQIDPGNIKAVVGDAKTKIGLEHLADAKTQLADAVKRFPKAPQPLWWLAKVESDLGDRVQAEKDFQSALALVDPKDPDAIDAYAAYAEFLNAQGRANEAAALLADGQKKLPDSAPLERALGDVAVAQGHFDDAIAHYNAGIERDPKDVSLRFKLGQALRKQNKPADAAKVFDQVFELDKNYPGLALERGLLFVAGGDMQKALDQFQSALAKSPNDPDLQLRVGAAYVEIDKPDDAIPMLNKVLQQRPNSSEAEHYLGRSLMEQGPVHYPEAMRHLQIAKEHDPNQPLYHLYVGWLANELLPVPDPGLARKEIRRALDLDQTLGDGYWQLGVLEYQTGAFVQSVKDLRYALQLKPTRFEAHATIALDFEQLNEGGAAISEWRAAFAGDDQNELWNYRFGKLLLDNGSSAEAAKYLKFAAETAEKDQPRPGWLKNVEFPTGEALRKIGDLKGAIEHYTKFMQFGDENDPDRRDAEQRLKELHAPYQPER